MAYSPSARSLGIPDLIKTLQWWDAFLNSVFYVHPQVFQNELQAPGMAAPKAEKKSSSSGFSLPTPSFSLDAGAIAIPGLPLPN